MAPLHETEGDKTPGASQRLPRNLSNVESGAGCGRGHQFAQRAFAVELQHHRQGGLQHRDAQAQPGLQAQLRSCRLVAAAASIQHLVKATALEGSEHLVEQANGVGQSG